MNRAIGRGMKAQLDRISESCDNAARAMSQLRRRSDSVLAQRVGELARIVRTLFDETARGSE